MRNFLIETERLKLRPFNQSDVDDYFRIAHDNKIKRYVCGAYPETVEVAEKYINNYYLNGDFENDFYIVIENKTTKQMIGVLIATKGLNSEFYMALIISKHHRRKGYMSEALKAFITFMPSGSMLIFTVDKGNIASLNTVMKIEGIQEKIFFEDDESFETRFYRLFYYIVK